MKWNENKLKKGNHMEKRVGWNEDMHKGWNLIQLMVDEKMYLAACQTHYQWILKEKERGCVMQKLNRSDYKGYLATFFWVVLRNSWQLPIGSLLAGKVLKLLLRFRFPPLSNSVWMCFCWRKEWCFHVCYGSFEQKTEKHIFQLGRLVGILFFCGFLSGSNQLLIY